MEYCKFCGDPRYKATRDRNPRRKKSPYAVLRWICPPRAIWSDLLVLASYNYTIQSSTRNVYELRVHVPDDGMTRGIAPLPPGRGRGRGKMVRSLTSDASDAPEASRHPLLTPPAADEPPQSPLVDPTPPGPSIAPPGTSTIGRSFAPSPSPSSISQAPTAPWETRTFITLAEAHDFKPLHASMENLQTDPPIPKEFLVRGVEEARKAGTQPNWLGDGIWHELQAYWNSDEFKVKSTKNKANRVANPTASNSVYCGGPIRRPPNRMEVFADCYKKKVDGTWSGKRAEEVVETYQKLLEERISQPAPGEVGSSDGTVAVAQEDQLWVEAAGGESGAESSAWGLIL
ncbi:UNVERIFIED_CONTAM: hypothetical protein Slati_2652700 [Sesamum latifolium]|uniref:Uncharacterized protein n=1 Tax=Sesamum latifolium TaxID=2727402 RepID=A0AAW2VW81_9LAMI